VKKYFSNITGMPDEVVETVMKITIIGKNSILMEYYGRLVLYTDTEICVKNNEGIVKISGNNLKIQTIDKNFIEIIGEFLCISYEN